MTQKGDICKIFLKKVENLLIFDTFYLFNQEDIYVL